jgi:glycosyltransferase
VRVSIITAVLNGIETIESCIKSVIRQTYENLEYIIIDGGSTDGTLEKIRAYNDEIALLISEADDGIYHALNKGLRLASGDVVGFLHGDDYYTNSVVIRKVVDVFMMQDVDSCYGDLKYVDKHNVKRVVRHWQSSYFKPGKFRNGWMPPHPTFFVRKEIYDKYGHFNTAFEIASDYELMLRFLEKRRISTYYLPETLIKMRLGGTSNKNIRNICKKTLEDYKAWKVNNLKIGPHTILFKNLSKLPQFSRKA